jgi:hypothetical protein
MLCIRFGMKKECEEENALFCMSPEVTKNQK